MPPLVYAVMGTSREIAIGPIAIVSLLLSSMAQKIADPNIDPASYRKNGFHCDILYLYLPVCIWSVQVEPLQSCDYHEPTFLVFTN